MTATLIAEVLTAERLLAERVIARGTVKRFCLEEGCGFISADEGDDDLFVRSASIAEGGPETLTEGMRVEFEVDEGLRGLEAFSVVAVRALGSRNQG
jgi:CspA family cold shock protein